MVASALGTVRSVATVSRASGCEAGARTSIGMAFAAVTNVSGTGTISGVTGSFDDATLVSAASTIDYAGFTAVTGTGTALTGVNVSFNDTSKVSGSGVDYSGFAVATVAGTAPTLTGITTGFDDTTRVSAASTINYTGLASLASVTGNGTSDVTGTASFALTGANAGNGASGIGYSAFGAASNAATVTGASGFDDTAKTSLGMTFAAATNVTGTGTISGVTGSFDDATLVSAASTIDYAGFTAENGPGNALTGENGSFNDTRHGSGSGAGFNGVDRRAGARSPPR